MSSIKKSFVKNLIPNFLVIGPGKSGTTWMYHALQNHPQICVSSAKETLFFETEFERGVDWYSRFFSHCDESVKAIGEVSNTYIFCSKAPQRIKSINPGMKIISCLRNPIERTFSHYLFLIRGGQINDTFRETLRNQPDLIEKGKYFKNLKPYFEKFDEDQIYISLFEDLKNDQISFIQSIYNFLEVNDQFIPEVKDKNRLSAAKPRNRWVALMGKKCAQFIRRMGYPEVISKIKYSNLTKLLYEEYTQHNRPRISTEDREFLEHEFADDVEKLSIALDKNLRQIWFE